MKKFWLACTMVVTMGISSCVDNEKDLYQEGPEAESNTSKFSTEQDVQVEIDYVTSDANIPFYVYDKNPLEINENSLTLNKSIAPLDGGWTNENGKFTGKMKLPAYMKEAYIVSGAFYATPLLKGSISNGVLKVEDTDEIVATTRANKTSYKTDKERFKKLNWENKLGGYNENDGEIKYKYEGKESSLTLSKPELKTLKTTVYSVLNTTGDCPKEYWTKNDLYIEGGEQKNPTRIVLTFIGGKTCWNNSLGYYYYRKDKKPNNLSEVKVYTIFPNTQFKWDNGNLKSYPKGVDEGTAVELKFFGDNGTEDGTAFPSGYYIGFVLACNTWNVYFTGFASQSQTFNYRSCSTPGFSTLGAGGLDVHTAMFKDKNGNIAIAFEDFKDDRNFTDVVFSLKSTPEITNVPPVDEDLNTTIEKTGVYAFEDEWPKAGDYDMNDVLVQYTYKKVFNIYNEILNESFSFKTLFNKTTVFDNGLGISFINAGNANPVDSIKKENDVKFSLATGADKFVHESNVILFTDNVKTNKNAEYKVTYKYGDESSSKKKETMIDAFIYNPSDNGTRKEIHSPMQLPTSKADYSFFGQKDDRSIPEKGIYYVSDKDNIYPFAFYLSNANLNDIEALKDFDKNEKKAISVLYPDFINWAKNGTNADWYKKK